MFYQSWDSPECKLFSQVLSCEQSPDVHYCAKERLDQLGLLEMTIGVILISEY